MNDFVPNVKRSTRGSWGINENEPGIAADLHNPMKNWFIKYRINQTGYTYVYFSNDGGFTWKLLEIPPPSNYLIADAVRFDIKFDYREPGAWYFMSRGIIQPHLGTHDTVTEYYLSRDQGKTYTQIPLIGELIGPTDKAEHFFWTGPNQSTVTGYKVIDSNLVERNTELLHQIMPDRFPSDTSEGYGYGISTDYSTFFIPDPNQLLLRFSEGKNDPSKDTIYFAQGWLYYSKNQKDFEEIYYALNLPRISKLFFDFGSGTVWLLSKDTLRTKVSVDPSIYRQSLWKRKVFTSVGSAVKKTKEDNLPSCGMIYNRTGPPDLIVLQPKISSARIVLYDILGHELAVIFDGVLHAGEYRFRLWETLKLPSQSLFVRIEGPGWSETKKIFIQH